MLTKPADCQSDWKARKTRKQTCSQGSFHGRKCRLLVQRTREAKIASDFSSIRAIFCVCRLCQRSGAGRLLAPPLRMLKTQKQSAEGPKPFRALTVPGQSQPVLTIWKTGKPPVYGGNGAVSASGNPISQSENWKEAGRWRARGKTATAPIENLSRGARQGRSPVRYPVKNTFWTS